MSVDYLRSEDGYDLQVERVARGVCVGSAGQGVGRLLGYATQDFGTIKYAAFVGQVARPLVNLALLVFFYLLGVQILGAVAAYVLSMAFGAALANGFSLLFVHRNLGFWFYDLRYAGPLLAGLAAAALTLALRHSIPSFEGLPAVLLFAPITLAVYFGVLVCLDLYPSDRLFLASFAGALQNAREPIR